MGVKKLWWLYFLIGTAKKHSGLLEVEKPNKDYQIVHLYLLLTIILAKGFDHRGLYWGP